MRKILYLYIITILLITINTNAQIMPQNNDREIVIIENDTLEMIKDTIRLDQVLISGIKMTAEERKEFRILQARVYKTYPYAKTASDRLISLNKNLEKFQNPKDKNRYLKIAEDYIINEFEPKLKKLSRKQGQILIKLINRQTGQTTYNLIKEYKSGWKAFWSNNTAKLFNLNLKENYEPFQDNQDYLIESILQRAFSNGRLLEQKPMIDINHEALDLYWQNLATKQTNNLRNP